MKNLLSINNAINLLKKEKIIAYPTESIYGLGCDPDSENAVNALLRLKKRSVEKGLILIADSYDKLLPYVNDSYLNDEKKNAVFSSWPGSVTWLFPKNNNTPRYLTGQFTTIAVRVTDHPVVKALCYQFGKPVVSTSANLSGKPPCRSTEDIISQFGYHFPILSGKLGNNLTPSQIKDSLTGKIIRQ